MVIARKNLVKAPAKKSIHQQRLLHQLLPCPGIQLPRPQLTRYKIHQTRTNAKTKGVWWDMVGAPSRRPGSYWRCGSSQQETRVLLEVWEILMSC